MFNNLRVVNYLRTGGGDRVLPEERVGVPGFQQALCASSLPNWPTVRTQSRVVAESVGLGRFLAYLASGGYRLRDRLCGAGAGGTDRRVGAERSIRFSHSMNASVFVIRVGRRSVSSSVAEAGMTMMLCSPFPVCPGESGQAFRYNSVQLS